MTYAVRSAVFVYIIIGEEIAIRIPYFIKYIIASLLAREFEMITIYSY